MIEIEEAAFDAEVIEASRKVPVLVDFWAPWCGPCRALGPVLEQLEQEYAGRFRLVKINSDANQALATRHGVRSIPYVIAFVDGKPADQFVGARPAGQVREFIERLVPNPSEQQRRKAGELASRGEFDAAATALRTSIELDPANEAAQRDLAQLLLERMPAPASAERLSEAARALESIGRAGREEARWQALQLRLAALREVVTLPARKELLEHIAANPADLEAHRQLAQFHIAEREFTQALDQLLEIIAKGRGEQRDIARQQVLSLLELLADQPEVVSAYRRRLSMLLHR